MNHAHTDQGRCEGCDILDRQVDLAIARTRGMTPAELDTVFADRSRSPLDRLVAALAVGRNGR